MADKPKWHIDVKLSDPHPYRVVDWRGRIYERFDNRPAAEYFLAALRDDAPEAPKP